MPVARTAWVDDDGTGTTGTPLNNAEKTALYNQIDAALGSRPFLSSTLTGTVNNFDPGLNGSAVVSWSGASDALLTGMASQPLGSTVTFYNFSATGILRCAHQHAGSTSANRFQNTAQSAPTPIALGGYATYYNAGAFWILIDHEQGAGLLTTFSAAHFSGNAAMTWIVDPGDVLGHTYALRGRFLTLNLYLSGTAIGGTPSTALIISNAALGGFSTARLGLIPAAMAGEAGASYTGGYSITTGGSVPVTQIWVLKPLLANWTVGALNIAIAVTVEVQ